MIHPNIVRALDPANDSLVLIVTGDSFKNFNALVNRALNCWDDAPQELKDLGDMLTHGRIGGPATPTSNS